MIKVLIKFKGNEEHQSKSFDDAFKMYAYLKRNKSIIEMINCRPIKEVARDLGF